METNAVIALFGIMLLPLIIYFCASAFYAAKYKHKYRTLFEVVHAATMLVKESMNDEEKKRRTNEDE